MAKRPNRKSIRAVRTYTVPEAAIALGVTTGTVRNWIRKGLPVLSAKRPTLILGSVLRDFLDRQGSQRRVALALDQIYCLTCKAATTPCGQMLDFIPHNDKTGRLIGLCETCGRICNRIASRSSLPRLGEIYDIAIRGANRA